MGPSIFCRRTHYARADIPPDLQRGKIWEATHNDGHNDDNGHNNGHNDGHNDGSNDGSNDDNSSA